MTTSVTATFDGKVLIPTESVDLPTGEVLRLRVELEPTAPGFTETLGSLPACGIWSDRTDLAETITVAGDLRRSVEKREDHTR